MDEDRTVHFDRRIIWDNFSGPTVNRSAAQRRMTYVGVVCKRLRGDGQGVLRVGTVKTWIFHALWALRVALTKRGLDAAA